MPELVARRLHGAVFVEYIHRLPVRQKGKRQWQHLAVLGLVLQNLGVEFVAKGVRWRRVVGIRRLRSDAPPKADFQQQLVVLSLLLMNLFQIILFL